MNINLNDNFGNIKETYLFSEIGARVRKFSAFNPDKQIIRLGIGDVTRPIPAVVTEAMAKAVAEMGNPETFRGYPPEYGYDFLRSKIADHYRSIHVSVPEEDIFVSDGAKSDLGNIVDILGHNDVIIPDPVYPVYVDSNIMAGNKITLVPGNRENDFLPLPDASLKGVKGAVIYLCSPNNPTGAVYTREGLEAWVRFANETGSLIIFDSAYEAFITDPDLPRSIYEIDGAGLCSIEISSFSKFAGFTGLRCGWTIVPEELESKGVHLKKLWSRRQATKFNGVSYPVQRAAEAALGEEGVKALKENIDYYRKNAKLLTELFDKKNIYYTGGKNSPYVWIKCPGDMSGWDFFDYLLKEAQIVGTPGEGFGDSGAGYFRITSFGTLENTIKACERLDSLL